VWKRQFQAVREVKLTLQTNTRTDQAWIHQLKQEDAAAIADLWQMLYTFGYNLARYKGIPEDLGHDAAVAAYQRIRTRGVYQYRFQCPFAGYCRRIVVNEFWRRVQKYNQLPPTELLEEELTVQDETVSQQLPPIVRQQLQPCLDKLPTREWQILKEMYFNELEPQAIAEKMDIERNYVNQLAFRARRKLRDCLEAYGYHSIEDLL
jgi:RNA polymerase sigma factor (sigma-70 family)